MEILKKLLAQSNKSRWHEHVIELEELLMHEHGFIPVEVLRKEPIPRVFNLLRAIQKRHKREEKEMQKMKSKTRRK